MRFSPFIFVAVAACLGAAACGGTAELSAPIVEAPEAAAPGAPEVATDPAPEGDATVEADKKELERTIFEQKLWARAFPGGAKVAGEKITVRFVQKGRLLKDTAAEPFVDPAADEEGGVEAVGSWRAFNPVTGNEFEITVPRAYRDHVHSAVMSSGGATASPGDTQGFPSAQADRMISRAWSGGVDNRQNFAPTTTWPWRTISHFSNTCTGTLIGPRHLVTAAHCINAQGTNNWYELTVRPGRDGNTVPYGSSAMTDVVNPGDPFRWYFTPSQWRATSSPSGGYGQYDIGIIVIPDRLGDQTGWMGYVARGASDLDAAYQYNKGYPACTWAGCIDEPVTCTANRLYGDPNDCSLGEFSKLDGDGWNRRGRHSCDASAGQSGSPLYHYWFDPALGQSVPVVSFVHTTSLKCANTGDAACTASDVRPLEATRFTPEYVGWISYFRSTYE